MSTFLDPSRAVPSLQPDGVSQVTALSFAQETMLFWDKLVPGSAVYNVPVAFSISGNLDQVTLLKSARLVLARHHVLRSSFYFQRGEPCFNVREFPDMPLRIVDLSEIPAEGRQSAAERAANEEARRPFDLACGPLLRVALVRLAPTEHIFILTMHHIAADGWSVGVMLKELAAAYRALSQGCAPSLPVLTAQYTDFARWQCALMNRSDSQKTLAFWKQQLSSLAPACDPLPLDHPRLPQQNFDGITLRAILPPSVLQDLARLGQLRRATAFMVLLTALQQLIWNSSGNTDIVIGVPNANRARPEFEDLIGCFINMVAVRTAVSGDLTFLDLLGRVRETALAAFLHSEVPFSEVVRQVRPRRTSNRTPIFQVQLVFQSYPMPAMDWPNLTVQRFEVDTATSKFDLSVLVEMKEAGLEVGFEYNSALFERATMQRLLDMYVAILSHAVKSPDNRLGDFSVHSCVC